MMSELFDEEVLRKQYSIAERRLAREEGRAEGRAEGEAKGMEKGMEKGMAKGKTEGETMLGNLIAKLLGSGRTDDALKVSTDPDYRQQLYVEFGLV